MKLGLALSGGGIRATVFHLGVLAKLSETPLWGSVRHISSVSGGTLCAALVFKEAEGQWPDPHTFRSNHLEQIRILLTTIDLQRQYALGILTKPWRLLQGRAHLLATLLAKSWGIDGCVSGMSLDPRWTINTTCYETGKNWRFSAKRMGDYVSGYVMKPQFPLADAVAASAAVPGLIGPLRLYSKDFAWQRYEGTETVNIEAPSPVYHLWDGGVYENQGLEALYKMGKGLRYDLDFCIVSDASAPVGFEKKSRLPFLRHLLPARRLVYIAMDQIRSLRAREVFNFFRECRCGGYIRIGETSEIISRNYDCAISDAPDNTLSADEAMLVANFPTTLRRIDKQEYELIFTHGYQTCASVLRCVLKPSQKDQ